MAKSTAVFNSLLAKRCLCITTKYSRGYRLYYPGIFVSPYRIHSLLECFNSNKYVQFSTALKSNPPNTTTTKAAEKKKGKPDAGPMITLTGTDGSISVVSLLEAHKISSRRNLKMVLSKEMDTKTGRPEYKLMTTAQYLQEEKEAQEKTKKKSSEIKGEKLLTISHKINEHDLNTRLKNICKWITKSYEVRIVINGDMENMKTAEHVYSEIAKAVGKESRFVQKRQKGGDIRFQILPPKKENSPKENKNASQEEDT